MHTASLSAARLDVSHQRASRPGFWRRLLREPLVHFVLLGVLIFEIAHLVAAAKHSSQTQVVVDDDLRQRLAGLHRAQFGVSPDATQLDAIVANYVDDEVLYREALALGLDQDDEIIRRRLIQKLEFLQRDSLGTADPARSELRAYYDTHRSQFAEGARVSFTHLYFSPDRGGDADALARATRARAMMNLTGEMPTADAFPLQNDYSAISRNDARQLFGASPLVDELFATVTDAWSQPVRSGFGWHLVKVTAVSPARVMPYDEVIPDVRAAYLQELASQAKHKQLGILRARYELNAGSSESGVSP